MVLAVNESWRRFARENDAGESNTVMPGVNYLNVVNRATLAGDESAWEALDGISRVLRGETERIELEYPCNSPDENRRFLMIVTLLKGGSAVVLAHENITKRTLAEEELRRSHEHLRALAGRLQSVREEQSAHIAREIHNVLGLQLTAIKLDLAWMKRRVSSIKDPALRSALTDKLQSTTGLVDTTIQTVQKVATELRPGLLDKLGLAVALEHEAREFARRAGLQCALELDAGPIALGKRKAIDVFRVCQEMMTNIARHAHASRFLLRLSREGDNLILEVRDDDSGIEQQEIEGAGSLRLLGIKERAQLLGGSLEISGAPGKGGTRAVLSIPLQPAS